MTKPVGYQLHHAETPTPEREALEHPHILFTFARDPLLVAMSARGLNQPTIRPLTVAKKSVTSPALRGRAK